MHMHVDVRTTIEIRDRYRAELLRLAANRGEKGFSGIIDEALGHYFRMEADSLERRTAALQTRGKLGNADAGSMLDHVATARRNWR